MKNSAPEFIELNTVLSTEASATLCGFSISHWRRMYKAGKVPAPIRIGERKYGWRTGELIAWIDDRAKATKDAA